MFAPFAKKPHEVDHWSLRTENLVSAKSNSKAWPHNKSYRPWVCQAGSVSLVTTLALVFPKIHDVPPPNGTPFLRSSRLWWRRGTDQILQTRPVLPCSCQRHLQRTISGDPEAWIWVALDGLAGERPQVRDFIDSILIHGVDMPEQ